MRTMHWCASSSPGSESITFTGTGGGVITTTPAFSSSATSTSFPSARHVTAEGGADRRVVDLHRRVAIAAHGRRCGQPVAQIPADLGIAGRVGLAHEAAWRGRRSVDLDHLPSSSAGSGARR